MQIVSFVFFGFVAAVFLMLLLINRIFKDDSKAALISNIVLLVASYAFITYADWRFAAVILAITAVTFFSAKYKKAQKIGIIFAVLCLAFFKYTNFFVESFEKVFNLDHTTVSIILPLGISFYTFSAISYIVDVSRKKTEQKSFIDVALYLAFFPKITSGPIQKSADFFKQISEKRKVGWSTLLPGIQIFAFGMFKKIVLADRLSVFVNQVFGTPLSFGSFTVFLATIAYSFQIYFDFSGYSDMAIGIAKVLGIDLPKNFNLPYLAHNVTEFWKRWHITLSSWLQEYLYISLGGNRKGKIRTYVNLILVMVIGGIWHGPSWTYVIWGLLHGAALAVHKIWMTVTHSDKKNHSSFANVISIAVTFLFTDFCWIFFRASTLSQALMIIKRIFAFDSGLEQPYLWLFIALAVFIVACIAAYLKSKKCGSAQLPTKKHNVSLVNGYYPIFDLTKFWGLVVFFTLCGLIICLAYTGGSPFIYGAY